MRSLPVKRNTLCLRAISFSISREKFHSLWANGKTAPNLVVITFQCNSPAVQWFVGKILRIKEEERNLMGDIIHEAQRAFATPLDDPLTKGLERMENQPFGCEHMIKIHLEEFMIRLMRRDTDVSGPVRLSNTIEMRTKEVAFNKVVNFMEDNMTNNFQRLMTFADQSGIADPICIKSFKDRTGRKCYGVLQSG